MTQSHAGLREDVIKGSAQPRPSLPIEPLIRIRPGRRSPLADIREIWDRRELVLMLTWRDLKVRYKQTLLGVSWAILQPLMMTIVFVAFFSVIVRIPSDGAPYPLFAYSGLLVWVFFSQTISAGTQSLSSHGQLLNKVYFPRLVLPLTNVLVRLTDLAAASIFLVALMAYYRIHIGFGLLLVPVLLIQLSIFALAFSAWLAAIHLKYRDIGSLLPVLLQAWMFASPVVYPADLIPDAWRPYYLLNPVAGILENLRAVITDAPIQMGLFATTSVTITVISLAMLWAYYRSSADMADIF